MLKLNKDITTSCVFIKKLILKCKCAWFNATLQLASLSQSWGVNWCILEYHFEFSWSKALKNQLYLYNGTVGSL